MFSLALGQAGAQARVVLTGLVELGGYGRCGLGQFGLAAAVAGQIALAPGEYFVAGDNREAPLDQHVAGITDRRRIVGGWTP